MTDITFLPNATNNNTREIVIFRAEVGNKRIPCAISWEALHDHFGADFNNPFSAFTENRSVIEEKAKNLIQRGRFENDGSILLRTRDF